jgi:Tfp pilus assembly protein PilO
VNRRAPIVAGAVAGLLLLVVVFLIVLPKRHQVSSTREQVTAAQDERSALLSQLQALEQAKKEAPATEEQIKRIQDKIPTTVDLPGLIHTLQDAANTAAVDFFSFAPGAPAADLTGTYSTIPSAISVTGSYASLEEFLTLIEALPRAAKVMTVTLAPQGTGASSESLQMQMTVEFYTTDTSAGPGSIPGPTEGVAGGGVPTTTSPTAAASPSASPTPATGA